MTLHQTVESLKKAGIGSAIGVVIIIILVIIFRAGVELKNIIFPPKIDPPTRAYGLLPPIRFPDSTIDSNFTYRLQTTTGELPVGLPDRLSIFPIIQPKPNLLNLEKTIKKIEKLDFIKEDGSPVPEIQRSNPYYEWHGIGDFKRVIIFNINSFDFKMTSNFLQNLIPLSPRFISNEESAIETAQDFLTDAQLTPDDLDLSKTTNKDNANGYYTYPQLFSIDSTPQGTKLVSTTSLSKTNVIRVDFYQKDLEYKLKTGEQNEFKPLIDVKIPIVYQSPPYSTMSFWIASGRSEAQVIQAFFTHQGIDTSDESVTYDLITPDAAYTALNNGEGYIASYSGQDNNILIKNIFLAYYLGETPQQYLMPVYVFEGNDGFYAYVSAVSNDQIDNQ